MFLLISICVGALLVNAQAFSPVGSLEGTPGNSAYPGRFPHQASLRDTTDVHICSASIIHARFLLTAGHCTQNASGNPIIRDIVVGALLLVEDGMRYQVEQIFNHPNYKPEVLRFDISIVRTMQPIEFSRFVAPIDLPRTITPVAGISFISGWGRYRGLVNTNQPTHRQSTLSFRTARITNHTTCAPRIAEEHRHLLNDQHLCTRNSVRDGTCTGDSGSPVTILDVGTDRFVQMSILSWTSNCMAGHPDVHTMIAPYLNWIGNVINESRTDHLAHRSCNDNEWSNNCY